MDENIQAPSTKRQRHYCSKYSSESAIKIYCLEPNGEPMNQWNASQSVYWYCRDRKMIKNVWKANKKKNVDRKSNITDTKMQRKTIDRMTDKKRDETIKSKKDEMKDKRWKEEKTRQKIRNKQERKKERKNEKRKKGRKEKDL